MSHRLLVDEHIRSDSRAVRTYLSAAPGERVAVEVVVEGAGDDPAAATPGPLAVLSAASIAHVLRHYGRPLADEVVTALADAPRLAIAPGLAVARLHWRAAVDADGRDWLVLVADGAEPLAALAPGVAAALRYIAAGKAG